MDVSTEPNTPDETSHTDGSAPRQATRRGRITRRLARWTRRLAIAALTLAVVLTLFCVTYNAATAGRAPLPPDLTYVHTGDINTRYHSWGDPHAPAPPVVLVHGFVEDSDTWAPLAPQLATHHWVQAYDMAGFGYTQRRGPYTLQALSDQLGQFLDAQGLHRPVLVAHSLGAGIVAQFALQHPDRVGGILFLDGDGIGSSGHSSGGPGGLPDPWRTTLLRLAVSSDTVINHLYSSQCGPTCPPLDAAGLDQWRRPLQVPGAEEALTAMAGHGLLGLTPSDLSRLATVPVPKSVVFGADDPSFSHDSPALTAHRIGAGPPTIIPAARHLTMISNPVQVAAAIDELASRTRPQT